MGDVKDKFKGFMKKVNTQFSSSSPGKFQGQGRVLGSSSSGPTNPILTRPAQLNPRPNPSPAAASNREPWPRKPPDSEQNRLSAPSKTAPDRKHSNGFDPFDSLVTSGKRTQNGYSLNVFECPVCGQCYRSEEEVSVHVESCLNAARDGDVSAENSGVEGASEVEERVGAFLSGKPSESSVEVVLRLLSNVIRDPENGKFRRIRMSNPKIRESVGEVAGGVELLEFVGFELMEEGGEMCAVIDVPSQERINLMNKVIGLLQRGKIEKPQQNAQNSTSAAAVEVIEPVEPKKIDRQIQVFFSVPENVAARIEVPDSFYNLSSEELKREADMRKKKIADSQLLIPKSYKEKQAKAGRKRFTKTIIRVQFPDGVVLQGLFLPQEPTSALYEFVCAALKDPSLEFDLLHPVLVKRRVIPRFHAPGEKDITLEEEDLVPAALIKFKPIETDSNVFTGLCNELLEMSEPLVANSSAVRSNASPS